MAVIIGIVAFVIVVVLLVASASRVVQQYERGRGLPARPAAAGGAGPGFTMIIPAVDRLQKVNMQIVTMPVPAQEGITRDNVTVRVDAVVYFKVVDRRPTRSSSVEDYRFAVSQMAQTSLRSIIGKSELDDLLVQPGEAQPGPGADDRQPGRRAGA